MDLAVGHGNRIAARPVNSCQRPSIAGYGVAWSYRSGLRRHRAHRLTAGAGELFETMRGCTYATGLEATHGGSHLDVAGDRSLGVRGNAPQSVRQAPRTRERPTVGVASGEGATQTEGPRTCERLTCNRSSPSRVPATGFLSPVLCVRTHGTPTIQSESGIAPRRSLAGSTEDASVSTTRATKIAGNKRLRQDSANTLVALAAHWARTTRRWRCPNAGR